VLDSSRLQALDWVDGDEGRVRVGAGVPLSRLCRFAVAEGWFPPVLPGTEHVSIGGAIAADIHGKNEHRVGTFGSHVDSLDLVTPTQTLRDLTKDSEAFAATVGGMGLTGMIVGATLRLKKVPGPQLRETKWREPGLDALMASLEKACNEFEYAVAWMDVTAEGRGVITCGDHVPGEQTGDQPVEGSKKKGPGVPGGVPFILLAKTPIKRFNALVYGRASSESRTRLVPWNRFFFPLDSVRGWNHLYGKRGFVQYQFVVPEGATLKRIVKQVIDERLGVTLSTMKRFTDEGAGDLSFALPGWSLAMDAAWSPNVCEVLQRLDDIVVEGGGRVYLAKDACTTPAAVKAMYPKLDSWRQVRSGLDPRGVLRSDLAVRLGLV
jgi:decaprenylphospho-beta-D-ribofuranose 2-oxidase